MPASADRRPASLVVVGAVGQRQVVARARRGRGGAAARRPPGRGRHARSPPDGRAHRAAGATATPCSSSTSARRRSRSCADPAEQPRFFAALADARRAVARSSSPCAPTVSATCRRLRRSPGCVERGLYLLGRDGRGRPAGGDRGAGPPGRPAARTGTRRPARARGRGRTRRAAAAVARAAPDLGAPRGPHADRRRLPRDGRHPRRRRPVGRGGLRAARRRAAAAAARPAAAPRRPRRRRRADPRRRVPRRSLAIDADHERADRACSSPPGW